MKNKPNALVLDFDKVLLDTESLKKALEAYFGEAWKNTYEQSKSNGFYDEFLHALLISKEDKKRFGSIEFILEKIAGIVRDFSPKLVFDDVKPFLNDCRQYDLFILSRGLTQYQILKIKSSGIYHCFKKVRVVTIESKAHFIESLFGKNYRRIIFVDDELKEINDVKTVLGSKSDKIEFVLFDRSGTKTEIPEVKLVYNLAELKEKLAIKLSSAQKHRFRKLKILCFGGGTGLSTLLYGLKNHNWDNIRAGVSMSDSGESSGVLKDNFGALPPGDALKCLVSLARPEYEESLRQMLMVRIPDDRVSHQFAGHSIGNLLLAGAEKFLGSFQKAVDALSGFIMPHCRVIPISLENTNLCAEFENGSRAGNEVEVDRRIAEGLTVKKLFLDPPVKCNPLIIDAIKDANIICLAPGSLYTSVLPNFITEQVKEAISHSGKPIISVLNLVTEGLGMKQYTAGKVVEILENYLGSKISKVIINNSYPEDRLGEYAKENKFPLDYEDFIDDPRCFLAPLWSKPLARHDSHVLAGIIFCLSDQLVQ